MSKKILAIALVCMLLSAGACSGSGALGGTPSYKITNGHFDRIAGITMWNAYVITQADTEGEVLSIMKDLRSKHPDVDCVGGKFLVREPDHPITRINLKDLRADGAYYKNYHVANKLLRPGVPIADYSKKEVDKIMHEDHGYEVDVYR